MAEALAICGGIASVMTLLKQVTSIYDFFGNSPNDIQTVATEMGMLRSTLDALIRSTQHSNDQGFEMEDFKSKLLKTSEQLQKLEESMKRCLEEDDGGMKLRRSQRVMFRFKKKNFEEQLAVIDRMKTTMMTAKSNLESTLLQKRCDDIQTSIASMSTAQADTKEVMLEILVNNNRTRNSVEGLVNFCIDSLHQKIAETLQSKQEKSKSALSHQRKTRYRASPAPPTTKQPPSECTSVFEEFAENPFYLLVVCIFTNGTKSQAAVRQARNLLQQYPTPEALANAKYDDVESFFAHLGRSTRAQWLIELAKVWLVDPPQTHKLQKKRSGKSTLSSEIAHLKGVGVFAIDTWRIFCKDDLYKKAGIRIETPEWKKVLPANEGLAAYLRNRWRKEGFDWDPSDGTLQERGSEVQVLVEESHQQNKNN